MFKNYQNQADQWGWSSRMCRRKPRKTHKNWIREIKKRKLIWWWRHYGFGEVFISAGSPSLRIRGNGVLAWKCFIVLQTSLLRLMILERRPLPMQVGNLSCRPSRWRVHLSLEAPPSCHHSYPVRIFR